MKASNVADDRSFGDSALMYAAQVAELQAEVARLTAELDELRQEDPGIVYLLWSNKDQMWWRPDSMGYTDVREEAGRYSEEEAVRKVVASSHSGILEHVTCMVAAPDNWNRP